uniref:U9-Liphistoxin-Lm1a_1 n=1 Tax=Liphistius malayanus TaxID=1203467 RepID=A0A482ZBC2_9ARAC
MKSFILVLIVLAVFIFISGFVDSGSVNDDEVVVREDTGRECVGYRKSCNGNCCDNRACECNGFRQNCRCGRKRWFG